jgi:methylase of polypeptide subunit release factors
VEVQPAFAELIDRNAAINRLSHRVRAVCADLRELRAADFGKEVDLVFSNPPYMKCNTGKRNEADEKYVNELDKIKSEDRYVSKKKGSGNNSEAVQAFINENLKERSIKK